MALGFINKLYLVERQIKLLNVNEIYQAGSKKCTHTQRAEKWLGLNRPRID
ncbi:hypothetical protein OAA14_02925 [bacterium]|jgi:hypothetical protein|nr:hypothetical protein [bacterium]